MATQISALKRITNNISERIASCSFDNKPHLKTFHNQLVDPNLNQFDLVKWLQQKKLLSSLTLSCFINKADIQELDLQDSVFLFKCHGKRNFYDELAYINEEDIPLINDGNHKTISLNNYKQLFYKGLMTDDFDYFSVNSVYNPVFVESTPLLRLVLPRVRFDTTGWLARNTGSSLYKAESIVKYLGSHA